MRAIDKKLILYFTCGLIACGLLWYLTSGDGDTIRDRVDDAHSRVDESREELNRARETHQEITNAIGRLEGHIEELDRTSGELEKGNSNIGSIAEEARNLAQEDRASLARGRIIIDEVERRNTEKREEGSAKAEDMADDSRGKFSLGGG